MLDILKTKVQFLQSLKRTKKYPDFSESIKREKKGKILCPGIQVNVP